MSTRMAPVQTFLVVLALGAPLGAVAGQGQEHADDGSVGAAGSPTIEARVRTLPIEIDGVPDEPAWAAAEIGSGFVQRAPNPGRPVSFMTEVRVLQDDQALYIAFRLSDPSPDSIVARLARRDEAVYSDWVSVSIDGYHDRRTASVFALNAAGVQRDLKASDDAAPDASWDAVWAGAAQVGANGWSAEIRIPLSQIRFNGGERTWGINFGRTIARLAETAEWAPVPQEVGSEVAYFGELVRAVAASAPRHMEVRPYVLSKLTREPGDPANPFYSANDVRHALGADVRVGLTPALTLNATINPDFGQVEADPSVVNLSAFPTFYPERRPFFLDGAETFRAAGPQLFYSRRIGAAPLGGLPEPSLFRNVPETVTILGAAKLTGKTSDGWSIGFLDAVTQAEAAPYIAAGGDRREARVEPAANYAVARIARDLNGGATTIGGRFTAVNRFAGADHLDGLHEQAYTGGADLRHRLGGVWEIRAAALGTLVRGDTAALRITQLGAGHYFQRPGADHLSYDPEATTLGGSYLELSLDRVAGGSWRYGVSSARTSPGFEINDLGFGFSNDRFTIHPYVRYASYQSGARLRSWNAGVSSYVDHTLGGERRELNFAAYANAQLNSGWGAGIWGMRHLAGVDDSRLRGGPAVWRPARWMGQVHAFSDPRGTVGAQLSTFWVAEDGTGTRDLNTTATVNVRPSERLNLSLAPRVSFGTDTWQYVGRRGGAAGDPAAEYVVGRLDQTTAALSLRADYTVSPSLSFQAYAQPFVSAGEYGRFRAVADPLARDESERFVATDDVTPPDFNVRQLRSNLVARWEYRPGSVVYAVWSQGLASRGGDGSLRAAHDLRELLDTPGRNVFMVKASYWLGL